MKPIIAITMHPQLVSSELLELVIVGLVTRVSGITGITGAKVEVDTPIWSQSDFNEE